MSVPNYLSYVNQQVAAAGVPEYTLVSELPAAPGNGDTCLLNGVLLSAFDGKWAPALFVRTTKVTNLSFALSDAAVPAGWTTNTGTKSAGLPFTFGGTSGYALRATLPGTPTTVVFENVVSSGVGRPWPLLQNASARLQGLFPNSTTAFVQRIDGNGTVRGRAVPCPSGSTIILHLAADGGYVYVLGDTAAAGWSAANNDLVAGGALQLDLLNTLSGLSACSIDAITVYT